MDAFVFVITTLVLGALCSIPGILLGRVLAAKGIATDQSVLVVISSIIGLFLSRLILPNVPVGYIAAFFIILIPIGVYRHDLWTTFREGRWWWSKKSTEHQPIFNLPVSIIVSIAIGGVILILIFGIWILISRFS